VLLFGACESEPLKSLAPLYDTAPVETRTIEVTVDAAGVIEPEITVEVKSKASGEILAMHAETGDVVDAGSLLVEIDQRTPRNRFAQAEAGLVAAKARRVIADTQMQRAKTLVESGTLTEADYEQSQLELANAQAEVIGMEVAVENERIAMDDTEIRAPITGTIIERSVEPGTVISSPTRDARAASVPSDPPSQLAAVDFAALTGNVVQHFPKFQAPTAAYFLLSWCPPACVLSFLFATKAPLTT